MGRHARRDHLSGRTITPLRFRDACSTRYSWRPDVPHPDGVFTLDRLSSPARCATILITR